MHTPRREREIRPKLFLGRFDAPLSPPHCTFIDMAQAFFHGLGLFLSIFLSAPCVITRVLVLHFQQFNVQQIIMLPF
jgi:hypothetical protein